MPSGQPSQEANGPMSLQQQNQHTKQQNKNNKNWNPFEDMKNFAELTEEALVDQEFDQLRENERKDPFQSAPFALNH